MARISKERNGLFKVVEMKCAPSTIQIKTTVSRNEITYTCELVHCAGVCVLGCRPESHVCMGGESQ